MFENLYQQYGNLEGMGTIAFDPSSLHNLQFNGNFSGASPSFAPSFTEGLQFGTPQTSAQPGFFSNLMGKANSMGDSLAQNQSALGFGLSAAQGMFNTWNTYQNNRRQEDLLNFQKEMYNRNYEQARKMTNMELSDRQDRRIAATGVGPTATAIPKDEYMKKWGV